MTSEEVGLPLYRESSSQLLSASTTVAEKTKEQASLVGDTVVASVNTVAKQTVEGAETVVTTSGLVSKVGVIFPPMRPYHKEEATSTQSHCHTYLAMPTEPVV
uniref:Gamma-synuclein n=1 Tax=Pseudonaja textilis TaxID=8673 RepID=A0A670Z1D0_PSETE